MKKVPDSNRPTIYICVEIKNREFYSQVLLADYLVKSGFRCYLGTHAAIFAILSSKKSKSGIFFDKGTLPESKMKWVKTKCEFIAILDQEAGPAVNDASKARAQVLTRLYPGSIPLIDRYFCIGPIIFREAKILFAEDSNKVRMTGWPRIDFFRFFGQEVYKRQIQEIRRQYGKFLLFVSDFPVINIKKQYTDDGEDFGTTVQLLHNAIESIKSWDANETVLPIIVRPHLMEDPRIWQSLLGKLTKTQVIKTLEITPWILASEGIIHRGSTSSIQAKLASKPIYFLESAARINLDTPQVLLSDYVISTSKPPSPIVLSDAQARLEKASAILNPLILLENNPAIFRVARELVALLTKSEPPIKLWNVLFSQVNFNAMKRVVGLLLHEMKWFFRFSVSPPYSAFVPEGLKRREIEGILDSLGSRNIRIRFVTKNCWELS